MLCSSLRVVESILCGRCGKALPLPGQTIAVPSPKCDVFARGTNIATRGASPSYVLQWTKNTMVTSVSNSPAASAASATPSIAQIRSDLTAALIAAGVTDAKR
jgi:hypothetical protein